MKNFYTFLLAGILSAGSAAAQSCYSGWNYRMPVTITNTNATALSNHEVQLSINTSALISAGKMQAQGSDIRFYGGGCCDSISYFIESGINTATTNIWVKVPSVPANGTTVIYMLYGNAAAQPGSSAQATFSFYEGFNGNTLQNFTVQGCGSGTNTVSGGLLNMSWSGSHILTSNALFPVGTVYTAEASVNSATGDWPGVHWLKDNADNRGYAILQGGGQVRISKSGTNTSYCQGHNWASSLFPLGSSAGIWSSTWVATGNVLGSHPSTGPITSTDAEHTRDANMRLALGGISSGTGSISFDWVRARKYAANTPTAANGSEQNTNFLYVSLPADTLLLCPGDSAIVTASAGLNNYTWSNGSSGQSTYASLSGYLSVSASNGLGCVSSDSVFVDVHSVTPLNLGNDTTVCAGSALILDAGSYSSYLWSSGQNTQTISPNTAGAYSVTVTDANGCNQNDMLILTYFSPVTAVFSSNATPLSLSVNFQNTSTGATSYSWNFGDGNTSSQQNPTHVYAASGTYNVCLTATSADGCTNEQCSNITVNSLSNESFAQAGISMYPNPVSHMLNLSLPASFSASSVSVIDATGTTVWQKNTASEGMLSIDVQALRSGMYILRIQSAAGLMHAGFIKN